MRTIAYVDGFNLYYGSLRGTPHRWLDLSAYFARAFPENDVSRVRYFTAEVKSRPNDPDQLRRQRAYLRALDTSPAVTVHFGTYLPTKVRARLVKPLPDGTEFVRVHKSEEKGSDVNMATYLLLDAFRGEYDAALVVTNDSDLVEPIRVVRREFGKKAVAVMPCCNPGRRESVDLKKAASKAVRVDAAVLAASQFPSAIPDAHGAVHRPAGW